MKKTFSSKKSAFSLIELSIVLIIIGLLIAGVTGGASLIKSSELRAAISEARGWSTAVNGFYNQFNAYPGDYNVVLGTDLGGLGNGNSRIEAATVANNPSGAPSTTAACDQTSGTVGCTYEDDVAWLQLRNAGVVDTNVISTTTVSGTWTIANNSTFGITNPISKIKSSGWVFDYGMPQSTAAASVTQSGQNVVVLTGAITGTTAPSATTTNASGDRTFVNTYGGNSFAAAAVTAADALSIDTKVDDGSPITGRVRGVNPGAGNLNATYTASSTTVNTECYYTASSVGFYNTPNSSKTCAVSYQVDLNS